ncbi:MAG TPA: hypothetical protein VGO11_11300 [Chthoniobacteraceae bacterium]|nr:hypothetical protein [Chthoniobacteraceae bacterium]
MTRIGYDRFSAFSGCSTFGRNLTLAAKEKAGEPSAPPGPPLAEAESAVFVTGDCVRT